MRAVLISLTILAIILLAIWYFAGSSEYSNFISKRSQISDPRLTELEDKTRAPLWIQTLGIPVPKMYRISANPRRDMPRDKFPYVLKTNHMAGGKGVLVIRNADDLNKALPTIEKLLKQRMMSERCTSEIYPRLALAEEFIPDARDVKVFIFNGRARAIVYIKNGIRYWLYPDYRPVGLPVINAPQVFWKRPEPTKPEFWDEILSAAEKIAAYEPRIWKTARLDFLHNTKKYVFGEITFASYHSKLYPLTFTPFGKRLFDQYW